ncbi:hypothetical protein [Stenotrophomonas humi]
MRQFLAVLFASLASALAPALVITSVFFTLEHNRTNPIWPVVLVVAIVVALAHTLLFGLVAAGWLLRSGKFRLLPMLSVGFVIGLFPAAIWQHPLKAAGTQSSAWSDGVQTLDNGVFTLAGWIDYFQFTGSAGLLGAIGAITFYFVYQGMSPDSSFKPKPLRGSA